MANRSDMSDEPVVLAHVPGFRLGALRIDPPLLQVVHGDRSETLEPRVMQALVALAQANGAIVTRDTLIARCWDGRVVGENAIHRVMSRIRHLADDLGKDCFHLDTVPRVGYRLVVDGPPGTAPSVAQGAQYLKATGAAPPLRRRISLLTALLVVLALPALTLWWPHPTVQSLSGTGTNAPVLTVLPFRSLVPGSRDELMELGMAETLIAQLSASDAIRVHAFGSARQLASEDPDPVRVARALHADYVVDGSIQSHRGRMRVNARLLALHGGTVVWSDTFDADAESVFDLQDEIAGSVLDALALKLPPPTLARRSPCDGGDADLFRMHMQARVLLNEPSPPRLDEAIAILEEVLARDPRCARALASKAFAWRSRSITADVEPQVAFRIANASIDQALAINPDLAEAHSERGWYLMWHGWDWTAAEQSFKRAIALNPSMDEAHRGYAHLLSTLGRSEQALEQAELALQLNPYSGLCNVQRGQFLLGAGRVDEALQQFDHTLQVRPGFWIALMHRGGMAMARGDTDAGITDLEHAVETSHGSSIALSSLGMALAATGQTERADTLLRQLRERAEQRYVPPSVIAMLALSLGQRELALDQYEEAYRVRDLLLTFLGTHSRRAHPLRDEPRFATLLDELDFHDSPAITEAMTR